MPAYHGKSLVTGRDGKVRYDGMPIGQVHRDPGAVDWRYEHVTGVGLAELHPGRPAERTAQTALTKRDAAEFLADLHQQIARAAESATAAPQVPSPTREADTRAEQRADADARGPLYAITSTSGRGALTTTYALTEDAARTACAELVRRGHTDIASQPPLPHHDPVAWLEELGAQRAGYRAAAAFTTFQIRALTLRLLAGREIDQTGAARLSQVDRMTIRAWTGQRG